jgi:lambda family phage portal protein
MVALVAETPMDSEALATLFSGDSEFASLLAARGEVKPKEGMIIPLLPGERLNAVAPARPAAAFPAFTMAVMRHIAAGLNIPYELLLKDFSQTNYSSARAALLEAWRYFKSRRAWLSAHWARPVYELWLEEAISKGHVEAPNFYERRAAWSRARWIGPGRGWIDPVKEANASETRLRIGITTLEDECAEQGADWEEVAEQRAREKAKLDELGLEQAAPQPGAAGDPAADRDDEADDDSEEAQRAHTHAMMRSRTLALLEEAHGSTT